MFSTVVMASLLSSGLSTVRVPAPWGPSNVDLGAPRAGRLVVPVPGRGVMVGLADPEPLVEPPHRRRGPPVGPTGEAHERGNERGSNHERVHQHRECEADSEQLDEGDL